MRRLAVATALLVGCAQEYDLGSDLGDQRTAPGETNPGAGTVPPGSWSDSEGDHWDLSGVISTDVMIYGDTSTSMTDELTTLGANVLTFTDRLAAAGADWHLIAVTGPTGCAVDGIFDNDTANFDTRFAQAIVTPPADRSQDEMGLQNARNAVSEALGGCNDGFLREHALLHVIFISDENDESPGFDQADYWRDYVDEIVEMKGSTALVRFSAVAGPVPLGCGGADPGNGYDEVVGATFGEFVSICDNWPDQLDTLADASIITDVFPLSRVPVIQTIEPWVNGAVRTSGWVYEADGNLIRFTVSPPSSGDLVDIFYTPA